MTRATVLVLLYGAYPALAERVLGSVFSQQGVESLRVWLWCNEISDATKAVVGKYRDRCHKVFLSPNICKYPAMRAMLYSPDWQGDRVVWLDDDAVFTAPDALSQLVAQPADLVGWLHVMSYAPGQREWIASQPWYTGRTRPRFSFAQGSCWAAAADKLKGVGYPWADLKHCGGDSMLGEVAFQQGWQVQDWRYGLLVNASLAGEMNKSPRRGVTEPNLGTQR